VAHAVVAMFDPAADAEVRAVWALLSNSNIDSSMMTLGVAPHLTLAVMDDVLPAPLIGRVNALAARTNPFTLNFDRIDMFEGSETVLYLAPQASTALRRLHEAFHESAVGIGTSTDHTRPGSWVPHATIAMALRKRPLAAAHRLLSNSFFAFNARVTDLAVIRFRPVVRFQGVTKVHQVPLGAAAP
jgi:2'-5' RNA ligase